MGKLGKKARKFAKKNLQSVDKRRRKINSLNKKKFSSRDGRGTAEDKAGFAKELPNSRAEDIEETCLDTIFSEDDKDVVGDDSDSDGYLSEDSSCTDIAQSEGECDLEDSNKSALLTQNRAINVELAKQKKKLTRLKEKDPKFVMFLKSYKKGLEAFGNEEIYSDEDETSNDVIQSVNEDSSKLQKGKLLTNDVINSWCQLVKEQNSVPALTSLINGYRAACHYGSESAGVLDDVSFRRIQNSEAFSNILTFLLREADSIFRGQLGILCSSCKKESILELKTNTKWKNLKPLIKSYLRSTLFLLNQITDAEMLAFSLTRLGASLIFFAAFPSLLRRLVKIAVHLWATGGEPLSSCAFLIIRDIASVFNSDCFDICIIKTYKSFIARSKFVEPVLLHKIQFMRDSIVELCSLDVQKSSSKALLSIQQLAKILQHGLRTKKKEAMEKICCWQYICCIDLWLTFILTNIRDNDLQSLLFTIIQIVNGVAYLFPGPRYLPLKLKCIQWLNHLSSSSGIFIPVASFVLDVLEYKISKEGGKPGKPSDLSAVIMLPKNCLKSRNFQEVCVFSAIELLSAHFACWSYHISFPEVATIPLIYLRKFHETTTIESFRRLVKRLIDQVEQNIEFVRKKRDEVGFSPKDQQPVESFLQLEKSSGNAPFSQYYKNIMEKAASRNLATTEKISFLENKKSKKRKQKLPTQVDVGANGEIAEKVKVQSVNGGSDENDKKKQRT